MSIIIPIIIHNKCLVRGRELKKLYILPQSLASYVKD
jgi:hypothetical protein